MVTDHKLEWSKFESIFQVLHDICMIKHSNYQIVLWVFQYKARSTLYDCRWRFLIKMISDPTILQSRQLMEKFETWHFHLWFFYHIIHVGQDMKRIQLIVLCRWIINWASLNPQFVNVGLHYQSYLQIKVSQKETPPKNTHWKNFWKSIEWILYD
jgi:hypothetical protein